MFTSRILTDKAYFVGAEFMTILETKLQVTQSQIIKSFLLFFLTKCCCPLVWHWVQLLPFLFYVFIVWFWDVRDKDVLHLANFEIRFVSFLTPLKYEVHRGINAYKVGAEKRVCCDTGVNIVFPSHGNMHPRGRLVRYQVILVVWLFWTALFKQFVCHCINPWDSQLFGDLGRRGHAWLCRFIECFILAL